MSWRRISRRYGDDDDQYDRQIYISLCAVAKLYNEGKIPSTARMFIDKSSY